MKENILNTEVSIPALDKNLFKTINAETSMDLFTDRGHRPLKVKIKDQRLLNGTSRTEKAPLNTQDPSRGRIPMVKITSDSQERLSVGTINFGQNVTIDYLYTELRLLAKSLIKMAAKIKGEASSYLEVFNKKLHNKEIFIIEYWLTENVATSQKCLWKWREIDLQKGGKSYKLVLEEVDGVPAITLPETELRDVADDMWEDECATYISKSEPVLRATCSIQAEKKGYKIGTRRCKEIL